MKGTEVLWLCTCTSRPIGIVKFFDEIERRWKFYIGAGNGHDEVRDIQTIIDWGQKFDNLDFLVKFLETAEREADHED